MDDNLKHIDKFYRDSLENYVPESRQKFGWGKLGLKLIIFNLGGWSLFAASLIFIGINKRNSIIMLEEIEQFFKSTPEHRKSDNIIIVKPEKVKPFDINRYKCN